MREASAPVCATPMTSNFVRMNVAIRDVPSKFHASPHLRAADPARPHPAGTPSRSSPQAEPGLGAHSVCRRITMSANGRAGQSLRPAFWLRYGSVALSVAASMTLWMCLLESSSSLPRGRNVHATPVPRASTGSGSVPGRCPLRGGRQAATAHVPTRHGTRHASVRRPRGRRARGGLPVWRGVAVLLVLAVAANVGSPWRTSANRGVLAGVAVLAAGAVCAALL
jgi:hypothetical protein